MYDIVKIGLNQKVTSDDLNRIGVLARAGTTALTRHAVVKGIAFEDFTLVYTLGGFTLTVSDGYVYKEGAQYRTVAPTPFNFAGDTPPSDGLKRIISLVGYALPARDDAVDGREFALVVTPASSTAPAVYQNEPRQTATLNRQIAQVGQRTGDLAPQPTPPTLSPDLVEIARVTLGRAGIERVEVIEKNRLPNLSAQAGRLDGVEDFVEGQGRRIDTLDKNLTALSASIPPGVPEAIIRQITRNLSNLNENTKAKVGDLAYGIDYGLDLRVTDNTYAGYAATVEDGIRFPWVASKETPLSLFTPGDPNTKAVAGLLLPAFDEAPGIVVAGKDGELSISGQVNTTITATKVEIPRTSVRTGPVMTYCTNSQFWKDGRYDATTQILTRNGETFQVVAADAARATINHQFIRIQQVWIDRTVETRWIETSTSIGLNGAIRGQSFRVPDFGYLTSIELPFTVKDAAYGVTLLLCETLNGAPNLSRVLERSDLTPDLITADPTGKVRTKFAFRPALVDPGKLYAWITVTRGNYALATVKENKFAEGTSFLTTDGGAFFQGDPLIDFAFTANFARFKSPRVEIRLNDVDNVNGDVISALKYLYGSVVPKGTMIVHQARRSGGDWLTIAQVASDQLPPIELGQGPFSAAPLPASVQQKVILVGTTTLMPALDLTQAWVTALKIGNVRNHVSTLIPLGTPCNRTEIEVIVDSFDPANHATDCKLIVGGATVTPTSVSPPAIDPLKPSRRTYLYGFTHATTSELRIVLPGTLTSILSAYHVESRFRRHWLV